jgi:glycosyltransferase involved in cell wall biosynthesis
MQQLLDKLLAVNKFDLVHVEDNAMGSYKYATRIPRVLTEHEVRRAVGEQKTRWMDRAESRRWATYQRKIWKRFHLIQVFTTQDAKSFQSLAPELEDRVRINPFGIDLPERADPQCEDSRLILFVGGFCHPPNIDAALWLGREIMPLLRVHRIGIRLTIVGSNPPPQVLALASEDILVTGRVLAVEPYLERAALVIAPVRMGGGMRLKVLQAMAWSKAVVTTSRGAEGLAVGGQQPPLVIADDKEHVANAVVALLNDENHRHLLGARGRAFVAAHHSWAAYAERLEALYSEVITDSQKRATLV